MLKTLGYNYKAVEDSKQQVQAFNELFNGYPKAINPEVKVIGVEEYIGKYLSSLSLSL